MTNAANIAEPVRAEIGADGRLISADPLLLRLHLHCGGVEGGQLAVPQLAEIARLSHKLGMNLSRPARAADENNNIDMWVQTRLTSHGDDVRTVLIISGWTENEISMSDAEETARRKDFDRLNQRGDIRTDASLRIITMRIPGNIEASERGIGAPLSSVLEFIRLPQNQTIEEVFEERQPLRNQEAILIGDEQRRYVINGQPLIDSAGLYAGYRLSVQRGDPDKSQADDTTSEQPSADGSQNVAEEKNLVGQSLFGSQLGPALRQPLNKIVANAETIGNQLVGPLRGNYSEYAKDIASAGKHLLALVEDLSDLEAIERDNFTVAVDDIDLVDLAHRVAGLLAVKAADRQMRIDVPPKDNAAPAAGEFRRVLQILVNLVANAIRYSPDGSVIKIKVKKDAETASISVIDQGDGIAPEDQEKIFEKFERLGRSGDGGSGLGLFISRRLAKAMNGSLTVESKAGQGAIFTLILPAR